MSDDASMIPFRFGFDSDAVIEQAFARLIHEPWGHAASHWWPAVDVFETEDAYQISIEIPGVPPAAVEIRVEGSGLLISGDRGTVSVTQSGRAVRLERTSGSFSRVLPLEHPVDARRIKCHADHGVLHVSAPKIRPSPPPGKTTESTVSQQSESTEA